MENKKELNCSILKVILKIKNDFPEINVHFEEIPNHQILKNKGVCSKELKDYLCSVESLLKTFSKNRETKLT